MAGRCIAPCSTVLESGGFYRLCARAIVDMAPGDASFLVTSGRSNGTLFTLASMSTGVYAGTVIAADPTLSGTCATRMMYTPPTGITVLTASPLSNDRTTWSFMELPMYVQGVAVGRRRAHPCAPSLSIRYPLHD